MQISTEKNLHGNHFIKFCVAAKMHLRRGQFVCVSLYLELLKSGDLGLCKYGEGCTFAFNQLEIDVWTEERKGKLDRNLLFEITDVKLDPVNSVIQLLQENKGMFIFLCQVSVSLLCCQ